MQGKGGGKGEDGAGKEWRSKIEERGKKNTRGKGREKERKEKKK